jgi:hypothetical protein
MREGMTMLKLLGMLIAVSMLGLTPASAANSKPTDTKAKACLDSCRARLIQAGTFSQYPRGYCATMCGCQGGSCGGPINR